MKRTFILKDKVEKLYFTLIYIPGDYHFPLSDTESKVLDDFKKISEIFFIFPEQIQKDVDIKKFSMLYSAFGYLQGDSSNRTDLITYSLKYLEEFYKGDFVWAGYTDINTFKYWTGSDFKVIQEKVYLSRLVVSIFNYRRIRSDEIASIYMKKPTPWWKEIFPFPQNDLKGVFWTHSLMDDERIVFLRINTLEQFLEFLDKNPLYLSSFSELSFGDLIASWVNRGNPKDLVLNTSFRALDGTTTAALYNKTDGEKS